MLDAAEEYGMLVMDEAFDFWTEGKSNFDYSPAPRLVGGHEGAGGRDAGQGLAFGLAFFLLVDALADTALGLAKPPQAYPWQTHARGLAGHLVFGLVTDTSLDLLDPAA